MSAVGRKQSDLRWIADRFRLEGDFISGVPYGTGHINDTYAVTVQGRTGPVRYILQRINHAIFHNVPALMENIARVTEHVRARIAMIPGGDPGRETLTIVPTADGDAFLQDESGDFWRAYVFIEDARTFDEVQSRDHAFQAALAFGMFQKWLMDLPGGPLTETIPDFHHTPRRFERLIRAVDADSVNRGASAASDIAFAMARGPMTGEVVRLLETGEIPFRVTHNDTKINNVMINDADGGGLCVIDLDTVMPGSVLYDFGDQIRTTTGTAAEDEQDLARVCFQMDMFESLVHGYLEAARDFLVPREKRLLAFCGRLITFEIGIRFLTDYLEGDVYFKTHRPGHNLDRARTQFEMVRQMELSADEMETVVQRYL